MVVPSNERDRKSQDKRLNLIDCGVVVTVITTITMARG